MEFTYRHKIVYVHYHINLSHMVKRSKCAHTDEIEIISEYQSLASGSSTYGEMSGNDPNAGYRSIIYLTTRMQTRFLRLKAFES